MFLFSTFWACSLIRACSFPQQGFSTPRRLNVTHSSMCPTGGALSLIHRSAWKGHSANFAKKVATTSLFGGCGAYRGTCRMVSVIERGGTDRPTLRKGSTIVNNEATG